MLETTEFSTAFCGLLQRIDSARVICKLTRYCSLSPRGGGGGGGQTSDALTLRKGALSSTEFLSRNECTDSRNNLLFLLDTAISRMLV